MKLFFIPTLSDLLLHEAKKSQNSGEKAVVVCSSPQIKATLDSVNITSFLISPKRKAQKEHDTWFAESFMPGVLDGVNFASTEFPVWQGLSIDRLRFWATDFEEVSNFIEIFKPDEIVTSLDYHLPFILDHPNVTVVKTHEIVDPLSREILAYLPVKKIIVATDREKNFAKNIVGNRVEVVSAGIKRERPTVPQERIDAYQAQYGARDGVLIFDKQYTWMLDKVKDFSRTFVCVDPRSDELLPSYIPNAEVFPLDIAALLTKNMAFVGAYNEGLYWRIPAHINVSVLDWHSMNLGDTLPLPDGVAYRNIK